MERKENWVLKTTITLSCSKNTSALLSERKSKNNCHFYYLNCFHSFRTKSKLELHKKVRQNKNFGNAVMRSEDAKILEFNQYQKYDKAIKRLDMKTAIWY